MNIQRINITGTVNHQKEIFPTTASTKRTKNNATQSISFMAFFLY